MKDKNILIFLIATGNYAQFVPKMLQSIEQYFLTDCFKAVALLSDAEEGYNYPALLHRVGIKHSKWPGPTLMRFHYFTTYFNRFNIGNTFPYHYVFYVDVDAYFCAPVGEEIFADSIAVQHCGFTEKRGTYETNPKSEFFVSEDQGTHYFGGGFIGGSYDFFKRMSAELATRIEKDKANGIIPVHNDESALNKYFIEHRPKMILSPSFHFPEEWLPTHSEPAHSAYQPKFVLINKWKGYGNQFKRN